MDHFVQLTCLKVTLHHQSKFNLLMMGLNLFCLLDVSVDEIRVSIWTHRMCRDCDEKIDLLSGPHVMNR